MNILWVAPFELVTQVLAGSTRAVLLVGTIIPSTLPGRQLLNDQYNVLLNQMITSRQEQGKHIMLVPMESAVQPDQLVDGIHPDNTAYQNIAVTWIQGVNGAQDRGWFEEPEPGDGLCISKYYLFFNSLVYRLCGAIGRCFRNYRALVALCFAVPHICLCDKSLSWS
jgi:hypothetical protein